MGINVGRLGARVGIADGIVTKMVGMVVVAKVGTTVAVICEDPDDNKQITTLQISTIRKEYIVLDLKDLIFVAILSRSKIEIAKRRKHGL